ncbi:MAG: hypothetical protein ACYC2G_16285 [Gemmatimonadaceae bacterium]
MSEARRIADANRHVRLPVSQRRHLSHATTAISAPPLTTNWHPPGEQVGGQPKQMNQLAGWAAVGR